MFIAYKNIKIHSIIHKIYYQPRENNDELKTDFLKMDDWAMLFHAPRTRCGGGSCSQNASCLLCVSFISLLYDVTVLVIFSLLQVLIASFKTSYETQPQPQRLFLYASSRGCTLVKYRASVEFSSDKIFLNHLKLSIRVVPLIFNFIFSEIIIIAVVFALEEHFRVTKTSTTEQTL